jgi:hypothetical protein
MTLDGEVDGPMTVWQCSVPRRHTLNGVVTVLVKRGMDLQRLLVKRQILERAPRENSRSQTAPLSR